MDSESNEPWYYEQRDLGFNYRMTELQAALGISQMERLDEFIQTRHQLKRRYDDLLSDLPVITLTKISIVTPHYICTLSKLS